MSPSWFFGFDVILEVMFAVICLIVALFSFKIYKDTKFRSLKFFGFSFLLISLSYMIQSIFNFLIVSEFNQDVCRIIRVHSIHNFEALGIITHMFLMTLGLSILLYTTLKDKRLRTLWLLILISFAAVFFSKNNLYMFYLISTIYLAFISWHYILNHYLTKQNKTLLVAIAFLFLLFGNFHFLISVNHELFYAIGHILELFAYLFIMLNLYLVRRR
jgi:hypothetical protein